MFADLRSHQACLLSDRGQCTSDGVDGLVLLLNHHLPHDEKSLLRCRMLGTVRPAALAVPIVLGGLHLLAHGPT